MQTISDLEIIELSLEVARNESAITRVAARLQLDPNAVSSVRLKTGGLTHLKNFGDTQRENEERRRILAKRILRRKLAEIASTHKLVSKGKRIPNEETRSLFQGLCPEGFLILEGSASDNQHYSKKSKRSRKKNPNNSNLHQSRGRSSAVMFDPLKNEGFLKTLKHFVDA